MGPKGCTGQAGTRLAIGLVLPGLVIDSSIRTQRTRQRALPVYPVKGSIRMQRLATLCIAVAALAGGVSCMAQASAGSEGEAAPIFGVKLPVGYRDWRL